MEEKRFLDIGDERIAVVFHEPEGEAKGTVVFCHGFGSDKEGSYVRRAEMAVEAGFRAVRFDFRGNNESSREFVDANLTTRIEDLRRVLDEVEGGVGVYGSSFGGLVAILAAERDDRIDALALRAPVTSLGFEKFREEVGDDGYYEQLPGKRVDERFLEDVDMYSMEGVAGRLTQPTLVMHGVGDGVVPMADSRRFFEQLECEKEYVRFENEGHRFSAEADGRAVRTALEWFDRFLDGTLRKFSSLDSR